MHCIDYFCLLVVGAAGFELATSCSQSRRSTKLSYAPIKIIQIYFLFSIFVYM
jgi:hypothetical protein